MFVFSILSLFSGGCHTCICMVVGCSKRTHSSQSFYEHIYYRFMKHHQPVLSPLITTTTPIFLKLSAPISIGDKKEGARHQTEGARSHSTPPLNIHSAHPSPRGIFTLIITIPVQSYPHHRHTFTITLSITIATISIPPLPRIILTSIPRTRHLTTSPTLTVSHSHST